MAGQARTSLENSGASSRTNTEVRGNTADRVRRPLALIASISASACAFLLVMLFEALFAGESERIVAYLHRADANVWVMQSGVSNMHMATSYLAD